jgi:hypothetical protein
MATDITNVHFDNCDLYRAEFDKATANKALEQAKIIV